MENLILNSSLFTFKTGTHSPVYAKKISGFGKIGFRPLDLEKDILLIYDWVTRDYARYWGMHDKSAEEVKEEYVKITSSEYSTAFIGTFNGQRSFLLECYDPTGDPVGQHYPVQEGDLGMHILVGPPVKPIRHFTWQVFTALMDFMFSDPLVQRIVVEPDVNNEKIHLLNKRAGFEYQKIIQLPHKTAHLAFCTRAQYQTAMKKETNIVAHSAGTKTIQSPAEAVEHLHAEPWIKANKLLICKAISEFAHELLISPEQQHEEDEWVHYKLVPPGETDTEYWFRAQILSLQHWYIDSGSIKKQEGGKEVSLDSLQFMLEFKDDLGIDDAQLPDYLEEITNTLYGSAYMLSKNSLSAEQLVHADYQTFEHAMTGGHPCFVANNGRVGFDSDDYYKYAPEADRPIQLIWLAGHKSKTAYNGVDELPYTILLEKELDPETLALFRQTLEEKGLDPGAYYFIPVHPWQWYNKLAMIFAPDIAAQHLVCLGYGKDEYRAQQSIRTFYNTSHPRKFYTKTALSVLNMGFVRGLTPYYMDTTPPITKWIKSTIGEDPYIKKLGYTMLCEVATVGYRNAYYEPFGKNSAYNKMLAALWRESPASVVAPGQQLMTMAALLHVDRNGDALLPKIIAASGKDTATWLKQYLQCYLAPLLHCFYQYDLVFMPHGENLILVMESHVPVKAIMKDITEEIVVFNPHASIPGKAKRICVEVPEELKILSIFTDIFDCFFRLLSQILVQHCQYPDRQFWKLVAGCVQDYQQENAHLAEKFDRYDLFASEFTRSCLNRLQLRNHKQMLDLADPVGSLQFAGTLEKPIAPYKRAKTLEDPKE